MGAMYAKGTTGVKLDSAEAIRWFRLAALQGRASAFCYLGVMHEHGDGVDLDVTLAANFYTCVRIRVFFNSRTMLQSEVFGGKLLRLQIVCRTVSPQNAVYIPLFLADVRCYNDAVHRRRQSKGMHKRCSTLAPCMSTAKA